MQVADVLVGVYVAGAWVDDVQDRVAVLVLQHPEQTRLRVHAQAVVAADQLVGALQLAADRVLGDGAGGLAARPGAVHAVCVADEHIAAGHGERVRAGGMDGRPGGEGGKAVARRDSGLSMGGCAQGGEEQAGQGRGGGPPEFRCRIGSG